jgi:uncharacterized membrane protein
VLRWSFPARTSVYPRLDSVFPATDAIASAPSAPSRSRLQVPSAATATTVDATPPRTGPSSRTRLSECPTESMSSPAVRAGGSPERLAEVTAIGYTTPIFVTIGAALFLGERLRFHRIFSVIVGIVGALVILRPGFNEISIGQLAQLAAAPLFAISFLIAKRLTDHASPNVIVAMLSVICTLVLLPAALIEWQTPSLTEIIWLAMTALFATLAHYALTRALKVAPISVTQPISFLQLVWATLLGITLFGEPIDPFVIIGGGVIVISATYISHRESRLARNPVTPTDAGTKQ